MWEPLTARLADSRRLVAFDMRGFGETEYEPGPFAEHEDVLAVADAVGLDRPVLVGASFGGQVALSAAAAAPERFRALVLLDTSLPEPPTAPSPALREFAAAEDAALEAGDVDAAVEANVRMWAGADPAVQDLVRTMQRMAFELQLAAEPEPAAFELRLEDVRLPVKIAYGEHDVEDFAAIARHLATTLPDATLAPPIPGAGHLPALEQPDAVAALVRGATSADAGR